MENKFMQKQNNQIVEEGTVIIRKYGWKQKPVISSNEVTEENINKCLIIYNQSEYVRVLFRISHLGEIKVEFDNECKFPLDCN